VPKPVLREIVRMIDEESQRGDFAGDLAALMFVHIL
jgi:hypothetical protein